MENLAEKSKLPMIMLLSGAIISLVFGTVALSGRMDGWQILLTFSIIFLGATLFGFIYELGRPNVLIKRDNEKLSLFYKRQWKSINIADMTNVDCRNTRIGRLITSCGILIIVTKDETIKIFIGITMSVILMCGLNGCGKTTLGRELARVLEYSFLNDEDYWFLESDIPFSKCRSDEDAKAAVMSFLEQNENCVIVASRGDLGAEINSKLDTVVYLSAPLEIRLERIKKRDSDRFADRVLEGGDMYEQQKKFYEFAATRTTEKIKNWLESLSCDVICLDGRKAISENIDIILKAGIH